MAMNVVDLTPGIGAEITGIDVSGELIEGEFERILQVFLDRQVMVIRGQKLSPEQQKAFSRRFGDLQLHISAKFKMEEHPEVLVLSNRKVNGEWVGSLNAGDEWHSDLHYMERPSLGTLLHALEVPEHGGETAFIDTYGAYDALSGEMQARIAPLRGVNSWNRLRNPRVTISAQHKDAKAVYETGHPDVVHPVARTHPVTGRKALYVSPRHTLSIEGMAESESEALLDELFAVQQRPEFIYVHKWRQGDLVMWDNRCTLHKACGGIQPPGIRHLHRTIVEGDVPA